MRKIVKRKIIEIILLIIGLSTIGYPIISNYINSYTETTVISKYQEDINNLTDEQAEEELKKAQLYNEQVGQEGAVDISLNNSEDGEEPKEEENYVSYLNVLNIGNAIGYINIPKLDINLPIYHGISENVLQTGVGHLQGTSLPIGGKGTHSVLAGHTGLASNKIFDNIDKLEVGDTFYIYVLKRTLEYRVDDVKVVEPGDVDAIERNPDKDYITLVTCTPYMVNTHRLLVRGVRVEGADENSNEAFAENMQNIKNLKSSKKKQMLFIIVLFIILALILLVWVARDKDKDKNDKEKSADDNNNNNEDNNNEEDA